MPADCLLAGLFEDAATFPPSCGFVHVLAAAGAAPGQRSIAESDRRGLR